MRHMQARHAHQTVGKIAGMLWRKFGTYGLRHQAVSAKTCADSVRDAVSVVQVREAEGVCHLVRKDANAGHIAAGNAPQRRGNLQEEGNTRVRNFGAPAS
jgi:hypothetical protein